MSAIATICVLYEPDSSFGTAAVNGLLTWAVVLGVCMAFIFRFVAVGHPRTS
jgi:hypothetical protein